MARLRRIVVVPPPPPSPRNVMGTHEKYCRPIDRGPITTVHSNSCQVWRANIRLEGPHFPAELAWHSCELCSRLTPNTLTATELTVGPPRSALSPVETFRRLPLVTYENSKKSIAALSLKLRVFLGGKGCFTRNPAVLSFGVRKARAIESEAAGGERAAPFGDTGIDRFVGGEKRTSWRLKPSLEHLAFLHRDARVAHYSQLSASTRSRAVRRLPETAGHAHSPTGVVAASGRRHRHFDARFGYSDYSIQQSPVLLATTKESRKVFRHRVLGEPVRPADRNGSEYRRSSGRIQATWRYYGDERTGPNIFTSITAVYLQKHGAMKIPVAESRNLCPPRQTRVR